MKSTAPIIGAPFILPAPPEISLPRPRVLIDGALKGNPFGRDEANRICARTAGINPAAQVLAQATAQADVVPGYCRG
jgi:hypothetical protein